MSINGVGQPVFQLGGLASGLNTQDIIAKLVQVERMPETQMQQKQDTLNKQKSAWQQINTLLSAFDTAMLKLKDVNTWSTSKVTSSDPTVLSVTGTGSSTGSYTVSVGNLATQSAWSIKGSAPVASATAALSSYGISGNLVINTIDSSNNPQSLTINLGGTDLNPSGNTLNDVAAAINNPANKVSYGVTASVVQVNGGYALTITSNATGASSTINTNTTVNYAGATGIVGNQDQTAADAQFTVNNFTMTSPTNTVTSVVPGVSLTLQKAGAATVNLATDTSVSQNAVQDMVTKYNSLMDTIAQDLSYDSDKKIAGDLFGDLSLQTLQAKLRSMMGSTTTNPTSPSGPYNLLSSIGITTSSNNFGESADLTFDTSQFATAMATNPQAIANMFGSPVGLGASTMTTGFANDLDAYIQPFIQYGGSLSSQVDTLTTQVNDLQTQIDDWEQHITDYQARLTQKFTAMEQAMQQMQSQSSSFLSQMSSWQSQSKS